MAKKRVIILYNKLFHYRIPIFNILSKYCNLTVAYSYKATEKELSQCSFKTLFLPIISFHNIVVHKDNILELCKEYEVVIAYGDVKWLSLSSLALRKRNFRLLFWTIGAPASYHRKFGEASKIHFMITDFFDKRADALVIYSEAPIKMYQNRGITNLKFFVANNTVKVKKNDYCSEKRSDIIFIGSLYMAKGLQLLLNAYKFAFGKNNKIPILRIIGDGSEKQKIQTWISDNNLENKVIMEGPIYSEEKKAEIFSHAIACISPLQAGLSVLESMGHGVAFITEESAITGGELFNIRDKVNGLLLNNISDLSGVILDITANKEKYLRYGQNSYNDYWQNRKPEDMARALLSAINDE